jgi:hypothetical protein
VVEARGALNPERHMYEEIMVVVEAAPRKSDRRTEEAAHLEWQTGSMFSPPMNTASHRQCRVEPGDHPGRNNRAECDELYRDID